MSVSVFFVVFVIGLLRRFLYPVLDPLAFVPNTFYTHNLSKYGMFQTGLHTCSGLNLNRGLNKNHVFASKLSFTQSAVLHGNRVLHEHHVWHKNHVLAGPVQALFVACRIALSMVASETRRRRLNRNRSVALVPTVTYSWREEFPTHDKQHRAITDQVAKSSTGRRANIFLLQGLNRRPKTVYPQFPYVYHHFPLWGCGKTHQNHVATIVYICLHQDNWDLLDIHPFQYLPI